MHHLARGPATIGVISATALVVTGVVVWLTSPGTGASFGWFTFAEPPAWISPGPQSPALR